MEGLGGKGFDNHLQIPEGQLEDGDGLFSVALGDRIRSNGLKVQQRKFILEIRKTFLIMRTSKHWSRLPKIGVESSSLETFKRGLDTVG